MDLAHESLHDIFLSSRHLVSILVLMDLAHESLCYVYFAGKNDVSILVLMDLAHEFENITTVASSEILFQSLF